MRVHRVIKSVVHEVVITDDDDLVFREREQVEDFSQAQLPALRGEVQRSLVKAPVAEQSALDRFLGFLKGSR